MPPVTIEHPSAEQLRAYDLGLLEEPERLRVEEHLAGCDCCCSALTAVSDDPFLSKVRWALSSAEQASGPATEENLPLGCSVGGYCLLEELGRGGMGVVYKAVDGNVPEHLVALKTLRLDLLHHPGAREHFLREVRTMARLQHDHIVPINYIGEHQGVPYFTMPLLQGETLASRLDREGRLPLLEVLRIGREIASGLSAAHDLGLIHRDIKPANVWLERDSQPPGRVKLLDFGLAYDTARSGPAGRTEVLHSAAVLGTPAFMAPEQIKGQLVDARCDLFGLGCVLYQLCLGQSPFKRETVLASLEAVQEHAPASVTWARSDLPPALGRLIDRLLAKDPAGRPTTARQVAEELAAIKQGLRVVPLPWRLWRIAAIAAILLGVLGLAAWAAWTNLANWNGPRQGRRISSRTLRGPLSPPAARSICWTRRRSHRKNASRGCPAKSCQSSAIGKPANGTWWRGTGMASSPSPPMARASLSSACGAALLWDVAAGREVRMLSGADSSAAVWRFPRMAGAFFVAVRKTWVAHPAPCGTRLPARSFGRSVRRGA